MAGGLYLAQLEFDYSAQTDDELSVTEDQRVWVLEDDDPEWFKVKLQAPADAATPAGLVPASYLTRPPPLRTVRALYSYVPSGDNEEELEIAEGEELKVYEDDGDWVLVSREDGEGGRGAGFVPGSYLAGEGDEVEEEEPTPAPYILKPASPVSAYVDPSERVAAAKKVVKGSDVKTWSVSEVDKKKKKKKGTLGVGNGAVFFASESDKTPVQQYPLSSLVDIKTEKSKHLHLTLPDAELHFVISSKDAFDEIMEKIEEGRSEPAAAPSRSMAPSAIRTLPPPFVPGASSSVSSPTSARPPLPSRVSSTQPPPPRRTAKPTSNATALYDFDPQGADELAVAEGDRLTVVLSGDADEDPDWVKVRKESGEEGVVPSSYVQHDEGSEPAVASNGADDAAAEEEAEYERLAAEKDAANLAAELRASRLAQLQVDREAKAKSVAREQATRKRISTAPLAEPIPVPTRGDVGRDAPPLSSRPGDRNGSSKGKEPSKKPASHRVRTWKDRTGQFKVDAEFLGLNGNKIRLHKLNGVIIEVPVEKMSAEDTAYIKKVTSRSASTNVDDDESPLGMLANREARRDDRHERGQQAAKEVGNPRQPSRSKTTTAVSTKPARRDVDWFDFFLNAGCDMNDCTRYGTNFQRENIEEALLTDIEASTLRTLGLREGDIIRVLKYIKEKYQPPPTPDKSDRDARAAMNSAMARETASIPTPPAPNLFTSADGTLKTTRRGRPNTSRQGTSSTVDSAALVNAGAALAKRVDTPPLLGANGARVGSPASITMERPRSNSTTSQLGRFDDDAWEVKTPAPKPVAPVVVVAAPPVVVAAAPAPPPAPPAPTPVQPARAGSAGASTLSYNDGLLAQLGIGARPPSAPVGSNSYGQGMPPNGGSFQNPAPVFVPQGPRAPVAPIAANQGLLAPLVPMPTNQFGAFSQGPMMPNLTGYPGGMGMNMGMGPQRQQSPFGQQLQMQPTGVPSYLQAQPTGYMQSQATGAYFQAPPLPSFTPPQSFQQPPYQQPQPTGYNGIPQRFSPAPPTPQPIQFNPLPPSSSVATPTGPSATAQFQPSNIFSSMKDGSFANGSTTLGPQSQNKYDALRPQPTASYSPVGFQQPGMMQPQQTGYGMQQGFPSQPQLFAQQTGMPQQQQQPQYGQNQYPQQRQY